MAKKTIKIKPQLTFFDSYSARAAADEIEAVEDGRDLYVTLKTYGGGLWDGWESVKALQNFKGSSTVDVPGISASFGLIFMSFADKRICSNQAKFMFHAVGGGTDKVNKESKKEVYDILAKVINLEKFKEITGKTLKEVLIPADGERVDVWLNAKEAKEIELIHKIYNLDPLERVAAEAEVIGYYQFVEYTEPTDKNGNNVPRGTNINNKISKMNKEQFKAENPAVYNEIYGAGIEVGKPLGATANQERIDALMEFYEIDPKMVMAKIKDPKAIIDAVFLKEISAKAKASVIAKAAEGENEDSLEPGQPKNEAKGAGKVDLSVIPEDVKATAMDRMKGLEFTEAEINAELAVIAKEYTPVKTK